ncbi:c-type cytochrome [Pseudomonas monteilii]|uniref:c-type cytochrome n=1 Tax=Pseudomonas monteilii TaxID=76759 RepID=UPI00383BC355
MIRTATAAMAASLMLSAAAHADSAFFPDIEKGRYLTTVGDCTACHTSEHGPVMAGGKAIETPFGKLVAPNLTPDRETGIGAWTDEQFVQALQKGVGRHGELLYGAFPYTAYTKVKREDLLAIRAYLATLPPVHNKVVANQLPFPFNVRTSLYGWNMMFFKEGEYKPDPGKSAEWNRGAYLAEGLAHCGTCHNSKNLLGGDTADGHLQGYTLQGWAAPTITGDAYRGVGGWSNAELVEYLQTGRNRFSAASGPMGEVVMHSTQFMKHEDLNAIATYIKSLDAGLTSPKPVDSKTQAMVAGKALYADNCSACHMANGEGVEKLFPSLRNAGAVLADDPATVLRVVLEGAQAVATDAAPTGPSMPSFAWRLDDSQVAAVATYIRNTWDNAAPAVTADQARAVREDLAAGH